MQCPKCQFENREGVKFCEECGALFEIECPACKAVVPLGRKFCGECGYALNNSTEATGLNKYEPDTQIPDSPSEEITPAPISAEGERKHVTVLFSDLVSRKVEMAELSEAVQDLQQGKGGVFSICGPAGTGKSRLIEEFKAGLDLERIQWIEGHAYAYSQNTPYFPLVDLLNRVLRIEEKDPSGKVREKVESGIESLVGNQEDIIPYVGGLYY